MNPICLTCSNHIQPVQITVSIQDAFILDACNSGIYVWVGKNCTLDERKKAMDYAMKYIDLQVAFKFKKKKYIEKLFSKKNETFKKPSLFLTM